MRDSWLRYRVLGGMLERTAQVPFRQLMRDLVFAPAGMIRIAGDNALATVPDRGAGYRKAANGNFQ